MTKKQEQQKYQAQDDAYIMAQYQQIISDRGRALRAAKVAAEQAKNLEAQTKAMKAVAKAASKKKK